MVSVTDSTGAVIEKYEYTTFGTPTIKNAAGVEIFQSTIGNKLMFTGRMWDDVLGIYDYRARVYNPELGVFDQTDPLGYHDSTNMYAYCINDPVNFVDPYGEAIAGPVLKGLSKAALKALKKGGGLLVKRMKSGKNLKVVKTLTRDEAKRVFKEGGDVVTSRNLMKKITGKNRIVEVDRRGGFFHGHDSLRRAGHAFLNKTKKIYGVGAALFFGNDCEKANAKYVVKERLTGFVEDVEVGVGDVLDFFLEAGDAY